MPFQTILTSTQLDKMRRHVETEPAVKVIYSHGDHYPVSPDSRFLNTLIEIPAEPPELSVGESRTGQDAVNAIKVHEYLGFLDRTQAADVRLWATLTHTTFWRYCQKRWPVANKSPSYISQHWFEKRGGGLAALRTNAIARLWWAVQLTVAPWESDSELNHLKSSDRYKYTRVLLSQAQIFQDVVERQYGSNLRLRTLLLSALNKNMPNISNRDRLSKSSSIQLLLELKNRHVEALPVGQAEQIVDRIVQRAADRQTAA